MKLYYAPGTCSLSPHIVLREAGLSFVLEKVDLRTGRTQAGVDLGAINPKRQVPALELDDGEILTEGPVIVQYIADRAPAADLAGAAGTMKRYRVQEWLNHVTSELHKGFGPLFRPKTPDEYKAVVRAGLGARLDGIERHLRDRHYLLGDAFSVADAYLFTVLNWGKFTGIAIASWPAIGAYHARVGARPKVREALKAEGLVR